MNKKINIYAFNLIKAPTLSLNQDETYLASRILNIEGKVFQKRIEIKDLAKAFFECFQNSQFRLPIDRVCFAVCSEQTKKLAVVSSLNSDRVLKSNIMDIGYSCFVSRNSSLFTIEEESVRISSNLAEAVASFKEKGHAVQKSLDYLNEMGFQSSVTIRIKLNESMNGFLFLNSLNKNAFDELKGSDFFMLCLVRSVLRGTAISLFSQFKPIQQAAQIPSKYLKGPVNIHETLKYFCEAFSGRGLTCNTRVEGLEKFAILMPLQELDNILNSISEATYLTGGAPEMNISVSLGSTKEAIVYTAVVSQAKFHDTSGAIAYYGSLFGFIIKFSENGFSIEYDAGIHAQEEAKYGYSIRG